MLFLDADAYKAVDDLTHLTDIVKRHLEQAAYTDHPTYYSIPSLTAMPSMSSK